MKPHPLTISLVGLLVLVTTEHAMAQIEEASYRVERRDERFEVRAYAPQVVAEVRVGGSMEQAGNAAFGPLFRYISGSNRSRSKIAMTAPVSQEPSQGEKIAMTAPVGLQAADGEWAVSFMMPAKYTMETLPEPTDERVRLREVPARRVAAVRYSGRWSRSGYERNLAELRAWMAEQELEAAGAPVWARYNAPFAPWFLRRNEVLIPLKERASPERKAEEGE